MSILSSSTDNILDNKNLVKFPTKFSFNVSCSVPNLLEGTIKKKDNVQFLETKGKYYKVFSYLLEIATTIRMEFFVIKEKDIKKIKV